MASDTTRPATPASPERDALRDYVQHKAGCPQRNPGQRFESRHRYSDGRWWGAWVDRGPKDPPAAPCTCGLDAALAAPEGRETPAHTPACAVLAELSADCTCGADTARPGAHAPETPERARREGFMVGMLNAAEHVAVALGDPDRGVAILTSMLDVDDAEFLRELRAIASREGMAFPPGFWEAVEADEPAATPPAEAPPDGPGDALIAINEALEPHGLSLARSQGDDGRVVFTALKVPEVVTDGPGDEGPEPFARWCADHVTRRHRVRRTNGNYAECSCGATFWRDGWDATPPGAAPEPSEREARCGACSAAVATSNLCDACAAECDADFKADLIGEVLSLVDQLVAVGQREPLRAAVAALATHAGQGAPEKERT